jgi:hypothetical protein
MKPEAKSPLEMEQVEPAPAFRGSPRLTSEDRDDILSLKRANPLYDSGEEDFRFVEHQWREERDDEGESSASQDVILYWSNRVSEDEQRGYLLSLLQYVE